ncbi:MAG: helix-turn-helix domain-containing protein [Gemmatimonadaceae bacterium]|nr:helix-turn-helix domain-containing protein [Gemmatimonadaceae bacterium]
MNDRTRSRRLLAYGLPAIYQAALRTSLEGAVPVEFTASWRLLQERLLAELQLVLLVVVPRAETTLGSARRAAGSDASAGALEQLLGVRERFPHVPMVGVFIEGESDFTATARLGSAGVADIIPASRLASPRGMVELVQRYEGDGVAQRVWKQAGLDINTESATMLRHALMLAHRPVTLPQLARALRMHERTLRKHCEAHGLPTPQHLIGWARCLMVAWYLEEPGRSMQSIAEVLGFSSPAMMTNHVRRYTRRTPSDLRAHGALRAVTRLLEAQLAETTVPDVMPVETARASGDDLTRPRLRLI